MEFVLEEIEVKDEPGARDEGHDSVFPPSKLHSNQEFAVKLESTEISPAEVDLRMSRRNFGNATFIEPATCTTVHHVDLDLSDMFLIEKTIKVETIDVGGNSDDPLRLSDLNDETGIKSMDSQASSSVRERKPRKEIRLKCETCGKIFLSTEDLTEHNLTHTGIEPLKCEKCGMTCFSSEYFAKHMKTHFRENDNSEKLFQCDVCKRILATWFGLRTHKSTHTVENCRYKCGTCGMRFSFQWLLTKHRLMHSEDRHYKCRICVERFRIETDRAPHLRLHTGKKSVGSDDSEKDGSHFPTSTDLKVKPTKVRRGGREHKCETCKEIFRCNSNLKGHEMCRVFRDEPHKCETCGKCFTTLNYLNKHMCHTEEKLYKCETCEKTFGTMKRLNRHMRIHVSTKSYKCDVCGTEFARFGQLNKHKEWHTNLEPHTCNVCERTFLGISNLNEHMCHDVIVDKPHKCVTCGKGFFAASVLRKHTECHMDAKSFMCDVCGKGFASENCLYEHGLRHPVHKRHKCNICEMDFSNSGYLRNHMLSHDTENSHKCDVFEKGFASKHSHTAIHINPRPYKCNMCEKRFAIRKSLVRHSLCHTQEKPFECVICGKRFHYKWNLKAHQVSHAGEKVMPIW